MARVSSAPSKKMDKRLGNIDQYLSPKKAPTTTSSSDNIDDESSSLPTNSLNERLTKSDDSITATIPSMADSITLGPSRRNPKRQLAAGEETTDEAPSDPSQAKKPRHSKGYAPPSTYAHLPALPDTITPNLLCLFVGLNPGIQTATLGHPYAHPTNLYWRLLHFSGLTPLRQLAPAEYVTLPKQYSLGNTNIVGRATRDGAQLSKEEMVTGAGVLDEKIRKWQPEVVCLVGKGIWEAVWKWKYGKTLKRHEFKYGFQDTSENMGRKKGFGKTGSDWGGARVFVATSTSGLAASLSLTEKEEIWKQLGDWVNKRREETNQVVGEATQPTE
ncbi:uracil-DNA glycosylase-like protein [Bisporella sp. PMI_857]|nr:uracil-DNA glycosylase-like protein [Bisporella sp. PMI_857]